MKERLTTKLGPLQVWVWGVVIGVVILVGVWWQSRKGASAATAEGVDQYGSVNGLDAFSKSYAAAGGGSGASAAAPATDSAGYASNQQWIAQGVKFLTGLGVAPIEAEKALDAYLNAGQVDAKQTDWINQVIALLGLPPQGTAGVTSAVGAATDATVATVDEVGNYVTGLYQQYLGRSAAETEITSWKASTGGDLNAIKAGIENSPEARALVQRNTIIGWYRTYLGRAPGDSEIAQYAAALNAGANPASVEASIRNSPEAASRR